MEVGAAVWVKDKEGEEAWVPGTVLEKSGGKPCKVQIEVDEEFSEEPLTFTFSEDDGEYIYFCRLFFAFVHILFFSRIFLMQQTNRSSAGQANSADEPLSPSPHPPPLTTPFQPTLATLLYDIVFAEALVWRMVSPPVVRLACAVPKTHSCTSPIFP